MVRQFLHKLNLTMSNFTSALLQWNTENRWYYNLTVRKFLMKGKIGTQLWLWKKIIDEVHSSQSITNLIPTSFTLLTLNHSSNHTLENTIFAQFLISVRWSIFLHLFVKTFHSPKHIRLKWLVFWFSNLTSIWVDKHAN